MLNKAMTNSEIKQLSTCIILVVVTLAVFWQVNQFDFITFDDRAYVTENPQIQSGLTWESIRWAFTTKYFGLWNPLVWLSLMTDYQLFGLKAGGYHLTNLIFHIFSTLLLFWLFHRMTREIWKSAFVAAMFALHPMHVESVAWVAERKDVLSGFFWMLTLCFYVYYTEKPVFRRYGLVVISFILALMSKPMVVTLPVIMILLDYWPLRRFVSRTDNLVLWQLKEKGLLFVLSLMLVILTLNHANPEETTGQLFSLTSRLENAPVAFVTYLGKTFWFHHLAIYYPFTGQISMMETTGALLLILVVTVFAVVLRKQSSYFFVGWMWHAITIAPVIGIIQISLTTPYMMADRYQYLPSIGMAVILAWGIPAFIKSEQIIKRLLFPLGIAFFALMALLAWKQCGYWSKSSTLFNHALQVTENNYVAHNNLGIAFFIEGKNDKAIDHYNQAIHIKPQDPEPYYNRGTLFDKQGNYQRALEDLSKAVELKKNYANAYVNRGNVYNKLGYYQNAVDDYQKALMYKTEDDEIYYNLGIAYNNLASYQEAIKNYNKAISLNSSDYQSYNNRGAAYIKQGKYQQAIEDFNKAISLKNDYAEAYSNRACVYFNQGKNKAGCLDAQKACELRNCFTWLIAKKQKLCDL